MLEPISPEDVTVDEQRLSALVERQNEPSGEEADAVNSEN